MSRLEQRVVIARIESGNRVWVQALGPESCERCAQGRGCGGGLFARLVSSRRPTVEVSCRIAHPRVGEIVVVSIPDGMLTRAAMAAYVAPLAGMFGFGTLANVCLQAPDVLVAAFGGTGLLAGFVISRMLSDRLMTSPDWMPVLHRRSEAREGCERLP